MPTSHSPAGTDRAGHGWSERSWPRSRRQDEAGGPGQLHCAGPDGEAAPGLAACEKMGTGSGHAMQNQGNPATWLVPVPIFSQQTYPARQVVTRLPRCGSLLWHGLPDRRHHRSDGQMACLAM